MVKFALKFLLVFKSFCFKGDNKNCLIVVMKYFPWFHSFMALSYISCKRQKKFFKNNLNSFAFNNVKRLGTTNLCCGRQTGAEN